MPTKLTDQQNLELAIGIAAGEKPWELSQKVGCSVKTIFRRMADADFAAVVGQMQAKNFQDLPTQFRNAVQMAFATILSLAQSADRDSVRLAASKMVMDYAGVQPPKHEGDGGPEGDEPIYAIRDADGVYRPIVLLPGGRVEVEEKGTS